MLYSSKPGDYDLNLTIFIGLFDSYGLFMDMYNHPSLYLNGTAPLNVTFPSQGCVFPLGGGTPTCIDVTGAAADSYLWYFFL